MKSSDFAAAPHAKLKVLAIKESLKQLSLARVICSLYERQWKTKTVFHGGSVFMPQKQKLSPVERSSLMISYPAKKDSHPF